MNQFKGFLIDLDGVIYNDSQPIKGASDVIHGLQLMDLPFRFLTNTTMKSRESIRIKLGNMGIEVGKETIFSAVYAASLFIRGRDKTSCHLLLTEDARKEFDDICTDGTKPDYVVVGDLGDAISFDLLNTAFQKLLAGAEIIALQKNRFWLSDKGYTLDAGAFVALLEFAANKTAALIGKPAPEFFDLALRDLKLKPSDVLMIGDDLESDIAGAAALGIKTCLVKTGKYRDGDLQNSSVKPNFILSSIASLREVLDL